MKNRLIVAGSRTFTTENQKTISVASQALADKNKKLFDDILTSLLKKWPKEEVLLISGRAKSGADDLVIRYAKQHGYVCKEYPALWDVHGKAAGMIRNAEMAKAAVEGEYETAGLLVFWDGVSSGTANMIENAKKYGLECHIVFFDAEEDQTPYYPVITTERVENNRIIEGKNIFGEEATYIAKMLGYSTFPPDRTTFPWERMEPVIKKAMGELTSKRPVLNNPGVTIDFLKFIDNYMLYVTAERLAVNFSDPPMTGEGMNPNPH